MDSVEKMDVAALLERHWELRADSVRATPTGHTNKTYVARVDAREVVLRMSWKDKSERQVRDETTVLRHLAGAQALPAVPCLVPTRDGQACVQVHGRWLHVFDVIPGEVGEFGEAAVDARDGVYPPASDTSDAARATGVASAMHTLARLHAALAGGIATDTDDPLSWLRRRQARVADLAGPMLPSMTPQQCGFLLTRIADRLSEEDAGVPGPVQWLHGDYHAGNLLYRDQHVCGILDFDDVGQGSPWVETAFALFALSRDVAREDAFVFDASVWDDGLHAYARIQPGAPIGWLRSNRGMLMHLFCADQVLIHLHAAQRGLWLPGPGMGFLGCVRQLWDARWP